MLIVILDQQVTNKYKHRVYTQYRYDRHLRAPMLYRLQIPSKHANYSNAFQI